MNKLVENGFLKKIFIIFLIIQPILDLNILYSDKIINIFKFSPSTLIRMIMVVLIALMIFFVKKTNKSNKFLVIYLIISGIYFIMHHLNSLAFNANITGTFNYSIIEELFYFTRMLIPVFLIYITYNLKLSNKVISKVLIFTTFAFSSIIILSSIFKFGIASYGGGELKYGFFEWFFNENILVSEAASQGIFEGANRLGVLLSALIPINLYYYFKDLKPYYIIVILLQIISLIIIGTKVASYTWIIALIIMVILYFFFCYIKKEMVFDLKKIILLIFAVIIGFVVLGYSPINNNSKIEKTESENVKQEESSNNYHEDIENIKEENEEEKTEFVTELLEQDYSYLWINKIYINNLYKYNYDPEFWVDVIALPYHIRHDDRKIQELIIKRVINLNNNDLDLFFGIGYSRFRNSKIYLEKDFIMHNYSMGLFGTIILLGIYIFTLIKAGIYILRDLKNNLKFNLMTLCCSLSIFVFTSLLCGHVADEMITYIYMALLCGLIIKKTKTRDKNNELLEVNDKISIIIPVYNVESYLEECLESILKQDLKNLEVILINDNSTDNSLRICQKYVEQYKFVLINNKQNLGPAISRNIGIKKATGDYIIFVDSDDYLEQCSIQKLYSIVKNTDADIAMARLDSFNSKGNYGYYSDKYITNFKQGNIYNLKQIINCISICSKIYKKDLIKDIKFLENTLHEDNSFTILTYFKANKIVTLPEYLYKRRIRETKTDSIMQNLNYSTFSDLIKNYNYILNNLEYSKNNKFLYKYMIRQLCNNYIKHVHKKNKLDAQKDIQKFIDKLVIKSNIKEIKIYYNLYFKIVKIAGKILGYEK